MLGRAVDLFVRCDYARQLKKLKHVSSASGDLDLAAPVNTNQL